MTKLGILDEYLELGCGGSRRSDLRSMVCALEIFAPLRFTLPGMIAHTTHWAILRLFAARRRWAAVFEFAVAISTAARLTCRASRA